MTHFNKGRYSLLVHQSKRTSQCYTTAESSTGHELVRALHDDSQQYVLFSLNIRY